VVCGGWNNCQVFRVVLSKPSLQAIDNGCVVAERHSYKYYSH